MTELRQHGFVPGRLRQALQRHRMTAAGLAHALDVTDQAVSRYLNGTAVPRPDVLRLMADSLKEPIGFFLSAIPANVDEGSASFMRSYAAATKRARLSAETLKERLREVTEYLERHVDLPQAHFPSFRYGDDPAAISWRDIEQAAEQTRRFWGLGDGPIANVVRLLEHHGAVVVRLSLGDETLDAFSQWGQPENRPYIVLSDEKRSAVRSRFDACHELGHMVLHRHLPREIVARPEVHKLLEKQAHRFAGAFLMPEASFRQSVFLPTLAALRELKSFWGAAIAAMIVRLDQLKLTTERQTKRLWESYAPWRRVEPLDDTLPIEMPSTIRQSFDIIRGECGIGSDQIAADLPFSVRDVAAIGGLPLGFFFNEPPRVRPKHLNTPSVLEFRRATDDKDSLIEEDTPVGRKGPSVHVVPSATNPGKFVAKVEGNPKPITRPSSQAKTIEKAIPVAKQNQSEVVIHGRDGKIRDSDSYGNDPNPPRDKKH